jgi:hypothetical protein
MIKVPFRTLCFWRKLNLYSLNQTWCVSEHFWAFVKEQNNIHRKGKWTPSFESISKHFTHWGTSIFSRCHTGLMQIKVKFKLHDFLRLRKHRFWYSMLCGHVVSCGFSNFTEDPQLSHFTYMLTLEAAIYCIKRCTLKVLLSSRVIFFW